MPNDELFTRLGRLEEAVDRLSHQVGELATNVGSLLESRSYVRGVYAALVAISAAVGAIISAVVTWMGGKAQP